MLRNDGGNKKNILLVKPIGIKSNRDGIGARLLLTIGSMAQLREVKAGSSYLGENDLRTHFGVAQTSRIDRLEVRWPSGRVDVLENLAANQIITIHEGRRIVRREPFRTSKMHPEAVAKDAEKPPGRVAEFAQRLNPYAGAAVAAS